MAGERRGRAAAGSQQTEVKPGAAAKDGGANELTRLSPKHDIWIDSKRKVVLIEGYVCLREGPLEMFACPAGTKEHESIVALNCKAYQVHAALVAVGAKPGHPVKFDPAYVPATGSKITVEVLWKDAQGKRHRQAAQQWVKSHATGKALSHGWVFGGSQFWTEPGTSKQVYLAEDGDLICVSNFTTATLDLPIESSADAGSLVFVANTEKIPPLKTPVRVVLKPEIKAAGRPPGEGAKAQPKASKPGEDVK